jgi:inositol oxygenase
MKRNYDNVAEAVRNNYRCMRAKQDLKFIKYLTQKYNKFTTDMSMWDAINSLECFVDTSDPDINLPNRSHLYQTAEGIRKDGYPDWMQLVGLIHDAGKCLYLKGCDQDGTSIHQQYSIVGDTFIVGVPLSNKLIFPEFNVLNSDCYEDVYRDGCGLKNCHIAYGHDEYLYQVLQNAGCTIPIQGLYMIRYHSLYPWHQQNDYQQLEDEEDKRMKPWVKLFNKYDLYTKDNHDYTTQELQELESYYDGLIRKYLPNLLKW